MAMLKKGTAGMELQEGYEIFDAEDDTLRATLIFEGDWGLRLNTPRKGDRMPTGDPLVCYEWRVVQMGLNKARVKCDFIGIRSDPTPFKIEYPGGTTMQRIETHERFADFAGTPEEPNEENGSSFDAETRKWQGFTDGPKTGIEEFFAPHTLVNLSYWTWRAPQPRRIARDIRGSIPGVVAPSSVRNFLLIGLPYRQVGKLYFVTEQYLGSGARGWDKDIYQ